MKPIEYFYISDSITSQEQAQQLILDACDDPALQQLSKMILSMLAMQDGIVFEDIASEILLETGGAVDDEQVNQIVAFLLNNDLIKCTLSTPRLAVPYYLDHQCELCGCSCQAQLVGPLSETELKNVMDAHTPLHDEGLVPHGVAPIMKGLKPDGTCLHFLNFPGKRCVFLDDNNLCTVHARFGAMQKPAACRRFPCIAIATESEIRIGIKPYCYANARVVRIQTPEPDYINSLLNGSDSAFYQDLLDNAAFRPVLKNADPIEEAQAKFEEARILSILQDPSLNWPTLLCRLIDPEAPEIDQLPPAFLRALESRFIHFSSLLRAEADKLGQTAHARHAQALCDQLSKPITVSLNEASPQFLQFATYSLYNAVFLRETTRFPALSLGAFALALGTIAAIQAPQQSDTLLIAWMRLFAQTPAFTLLFDSSDALASLAQCLHVDNC